MNLDESGRAVFEAVALLACQGIQTRCMWYCDLHDRHGDAETTEEAQAMADAHELFFEEDNAESGEVCDIYVLDVEQARARAGDA